MLRLVSIRPSDALMPLRWVFAEQVEPLVRWTASHGWTVLALVVIGMLVAVLARISKTRAHGRNHEAPSFLSGRASGPRGEAMEAPATESDAPRVSLTA
jgi:hypothetical protein